MSRRYAAIAIAVAMAAACGAPLPPPAPASRASTVCITVPGDRIGLYRSACGPVEDAERLEAIALRGAR